MQPFLAMITPLSGGGGPVDPGFGVPGWPAHPIAPGGRPPGIWGGAPPWIDNTLPGPQPIPGWPPVVMPPIYYPPGGGGGPPLGTWGGDSPWPGYARPPIAPGGRPPGIWGGPPNWIDNTLPGPQPTPGWPPVIMPPIFIPIPPGEKPPEPGNGLTPSHPIYIPGESGPGGVKQLVFVYIPSIGGVWFLVDVPAAPPPAPTHPIVEPPPPGGPKK
jgi:hypothetical protein